MTRLATIYSMTRKLSSMLRCAFQDENDRLDLVHHMITLRLGGKLHLAPIKKDVQEVLDLGTGMRAVFPQDVLCLSHAKSNRNRHLGNSDG